MSKPVFAELHLGGGRPMLVNVRSIVAIQARTKVDSGSYVYFGAGKDPEEYVTVDETYAYLRRMIEDAGTVYHQ